MAPAELDLETWRAVARLSLPVAAPVLMVAGVAELMLLIHAFPQPGQRLIHVFGLVFITGASAWLISLPLWLFWPLPADWIVLGVWSLPAILGEALAIPLWLWLLGPLRRRPARRRPYQE